MSLIKAALCISAVILLLPADERRQAELLGKAQAAAHWTWTFCDRNADTCAKGGELWQSFKAKAEFGGRLAYDMIQRGYNSGGLQPVSAPPVEARPEPRVEPAVGRGTLSPRDREPIWRGQGQPPQQRPRA